MADGHGLWLALMLQTSLLMHQGVVTASLSFEADGNASNVDAGGSGTTDNQYTNLMLSTHLQLVTQFTESVTLNVTNQNEERDHMTNCWCDHLVKVLVLNISNR